jgi:hypothetical protein
MSLLVFSYACTQNQATVAAPVSTTDSLPVVDKKIYASIKHAKTLLQDGDLVTRSDDDFESLALQNFSQTDRSFSHSGIAFKEGEDVVVYHSMTGKENPAGTCRRDPFDSFVNPLEKTALGIFRYDLKETEKERFHQLMMGYHQAKIPFDISFNMEKDDSLYCSELVYQALKKATQLRIVLPTTILKNFRPKIVGHRYNQVFFKRYEYISIDNLYLNPFCKEITRLKYR